MACLFCIFYGCKSALASLVLTLALALAGRLYFSYSPCMQKQQYTLFLTRDDGTTRSIRFCAATLRLLIILCVVVPVTALIALYFVMQYSQDVTILAHKNDELRYELQVYQHELQKYATIQRLVTSYEQEASPILMASKAVPAPVPYDIEIEENIKAEEPDVDSSENTEENIHNPEPAGQSENIADHNPTTQEEQDSSANVDRHGVTSDKSEHSDVDIFAQKDAKAATKTSAENILQQQVQPQGLEQDGFAIVTDYKAKLTDLTIHESNDNIQTTFQLGNATEEAINGHLYIVIQGHDKSLHPVSISEKHTAFRIQRFRDYTLNFALPDGLKAVDVDKIIISAKTRAGEVLYCNGFSLK